MEGWKTKGLLCLGFAAVLVITAVIAPSSVVRAAGSHEIEGSAQAAPPSAPASAAVDGQILYDKKCAMCHGASREGKAPIFPALTGVSDKYTDAQVADMIRHGKGRMPAFPTLSDTEISALVALLKTPAPQEKAMPGQ